MANSIVINKWTSGLGSSVYTGFSKVVGLDIFNKPGIIQQGLSLSNTGTVFNGLAVAEVISLTGDSYTGTDNGDLYKNGVFFANIAITIQDLLIVGDYLLISTIGTDLFLYGA